MAYEFLMSIDDFYYTGITRIESLGYHGITKKDIENLEEMFSIGLRIGLSLPIEDTAIHIRQQKRVKLGDSIIAASALVHDMTLVTRNTDDFEAIDGIRLLDPYS